MDQPIDTMESLPHLTFNMRLLTQEEINFITLIDDFQKILRDTCEITTPLRRYINWIIIAYDSRFCGSADGFKFVAQHLEKILKTHTDIFSTCSESVHLNS